jgi:FkbM family methyltransferase
MKSLIKSLLRRTPYRLVRARDANRFLGIEETLTALAGRGFRPRVVIDGGANRGDFSLLAHLIFPDAQIHMVEPQPMCREPLYELVRQKNFVFHPVALGRAGGPDEVEMNVDPLAISTGAHIVTDGQDFATTVDVRLRALDDILRPIPTVEDRALLKLDLQGYELEALNGMLRLLSTIEFILCEVSFYTQAGAPSIATIMSLLNDRGFTLHDIASIAARARDNRAHQADFLFVRDESPLALDRSWG